MKKSIVSGLLVVLSAALLLGGCTRVDTGEVGLRRTFNGTIEPQELSTGYHQTLVGDVIIFAAKEILLVEENMTPQTRDKTTLADFDVNFTYQVDPGSISEMYVKYSTTANLYSQDSDEIFPMGTFVTSVVRSSAYFAVSEYDALTVNDNRSAIEAKIREFANKKLEQEGLAGKVTVSLVNVRNIQLAPAIIESANRVVQAQNDLKAKTTEVEIAKQEALRIEALAKQTDSGYTQLLDAQAGMKTAEALMIAAGKGSTVWIVPNNFVALGNTATK